ncbi:MAG: hypothetical protein AAF198_06425 [Pseudomonadota bacterium]
MDKMQLIKALLCEDSESKTSTSSGGIFSSAIGKYAIIRSRNEGINAGTIKAADETGVVLSNARRIWYHKPAIKTESWYEGVANHGLSSDSKVSGTVEEKIIVEDYSITVCRDVAKQSIESAVPHAQN